MYNENLKQMFINEVSQSETVRRSYSLLMEALAEHEEKMGKDICQMSTLEIQPIVDKFTGVSKRSRVTKLSQLRRYIKWCILTKVDGACDGVLHVKVAGLERIRDSMVSSPAHLERILRLVFEDPEENTVANVYRCFVWLTYMGIYKNETVKIESSDVDFETMTVKYNSNTYPMYRESIPAFKKCVELESFVQIIPTQTFIRMNDRAAGTKLMRGIKSVIPVHTIELTLSKYFTKAIERNAGKNEELIRLNQFKIWQSGLFYRTYELERMGVDPDFWNVVENSFRGNTYKLDSGRNTIDAKKRQRVGDYLEDYKRWKVAFDL